MNNETLINYIKTERERGVADDAIRNALLASGWKVEDVSQALGGDIVQTTQNSTPQPFSFRRMFEGRMARMDYFLSNVVLFITSGVIIFSWIFLLGAMLVTLNDSFLYFLLLSLLVVVPMMLLSFSLTIRRLHDINWSAWAILIFFIPLIGGIFSLILFFLPGTNGKNNYGEVPSKRSLLRTILNT